ncbi:hypothetical protein GCM10028787_06370 [Brachybacterium horti]
MLAWGSRAPSGSASGTSVAGAALMRPSVVEASPVMDGKLVRGRGGAHSFQEWSRNEPMGRSRRNGSFRDHLWNAAAPHPWLRAEISSAAHRAWPCRHAGPRRPRREGRHRPTAPCYTLSRW